MQSSHASLVVIKQNGEDGGRYVLDDRGWCTIGSHSECDIVVHTEGVASLQALVRVSETDLSGRTSEDGEAAERNSGTTIFGLDKTLPARIPEKRATLYVDDGCEVEHGDVILIGDRSFRFEKVPSAKQSGAARQSAPLVDSTNQQEPSEPSSPFGKLRGIESALSPRTLGKRRRTSLVVTDLDEEFKPAPSTATYMTARRLSLSVSRVKDEFFPKRALSPARKAERKPYAGRFHTNPNSQQLRKQVFTPNRPSALPRAAASIRRPAVLSRKVQASPHPVKSILREPVTEESTDSSGEPPSRDINREVSGTWTGDPPRTPRRRVVNRSGPGFEKSHEEQSRMRTPLRVQAYSTTVPTAGQSELSAADLQRLRTPLRQASRDQFEEEEDPHRSRREDPHMTPLERKRMCTPLRGPAPRRVCDEDEHSSPLMHNPRPAELERLRTPLRGPRGGANKRQKSDEISESLAIAADPSESRVRRTMSDMHAPTAVRQANDPHRSATRRTVDLQWVQPGARTSLGLNLATPRGTRGDDIVSDSRAEQRVLETPIYENQAGVDQVSPLNVRVNMMHLGAPGATPRASTDVDMLASHTPRPTTVAQMTPKSKSRVRNAQADEDKELSGVINGRLANASPLFKRGQKRALTSRRPLRKPGAFVPVSSYPMNIGTPRRRTNGALDFRASMAAGEPSMEARERSLVASDMNASSKEFASPQGASVYSTSNNLVHSPGLDESPVVCHPAVLRMGDSLRQQSSGPRRRIPMPSPTQAPRASKLGDIGRSSFVDEDRTPDRPPGLSAERPVSDNAENGLFAENTCFAGATPAAISHMSRASMQPMGDSRHVALRADDETPQKQVRRHSFSAARQPQSIKVRTALSKSSKKRNRPSRKSVLFADTLGGDIELCSGPHYSPQTRPRSQILRGTSKRIDFSDYEAAETSADERLPRPSPHSESEVDHADSPSLGISVGMSVGPAPSTLLAKLGRFYYPSTVDEDIVQSTPEGNKILEAELPGEPLQYTANVEEESLEQDEEREQEESLEQDEEQGSDGSGIFSEHEEVDALTREEPQESMALVPYEAQSSHETPSKKLGGIFGAAASMLRRFSGTAADNHNPVASAVPAMPQPSSEMHPSPVEGESREADQMRAEVFTYSGDENHESDSNDSDEGTPPDSVDHESERCGFENEDSQSPCLSSQSQEQSVDGAEFSEELDTSDSSGIQGDVVTPARRKSLLSKAISVVFGSWRQTPDRDGSTHGEQTQENETGHRSDITPDDPNEAVSGIAKVENASGCGTASHDDAGSIPCPDQYTSDEERMDFERDSGDCLAEEEDEEDSGDVGKVDHHVEAVSPDRDIEKTGLDSALGKTLEAASSRAHSLETSDDFREPRDLTEAEVLDASGAEPGVLPPSSSEASTTKGEETVVPPLETNEPSAQNATEASVTSYVDSLTVKELREYLKKNGVKPPTSCRKADLVELAWSTAAESSNFEEGDNDNTNTVSEQAPDCPVSATTELLPVTTEDDEVHLENLRKLTVVELRRKLSDQNADTYGRKNDLIARLHDLRLEDISVPPAKTQESPSGVTHRWDPEPGVGSSTETVFKAMTVDRLRSELGLRGLDVKGKKQVLIDRLTEFEARGEPSAMEGTKDKVLSKVLSEGVSEDSLPTPTAPILPTVDDVASMKVTELRKELKLRSLSTSGTKAELILRMQGSMRNAETRLRRSNKTTKNEKKKLKEPEADPPVRRSTRNKQRTA